jgi:FkbM family methyltransferase
MSALIGRLHENDFRILQDLPSNLIVLDVGANLGQSVTSLSVVLDSPSILSIECNPACMKTLAKVGKINSYIRGISFNYLNVGFGAKKVESGLPFLVPVYNGIEFLQEGFLKNYKPERQIIEKLGCSESDLVFKEYNVKVCKLDSLSLKIDLLKIDVQGAELDILKSGKITIRNSLPFLFIELPDSLMLKKKIFKYLKNILKYQVIELENNCFCYHKSKKYFLKELLNGIRKKNFL